MEVHFYSFSKRENSTKQPTGQYTNVNVTLKEPTSVTDPVLVLSGNHLTDYTYSFSYKIISIKGRNMCISIIC